MSTHDLGVGAAGGQAGSLDLTGSGGGAADGLPEPSSGLDADPGGFGDLDLAAPSDGGLDLGAPSDGGLDLGAPSDGGLDLGAPAGGGLDLGASAEGGLDLGASSDSGLDLGASTDGGLDLGAPADGGLDLGVPSGGGLDLGAPADGGLDLGAAPAGGPELGAGADAGLDLGVSAGGGLDLPGALPSGDLDVSAALSSSELDLSAALRSDDLDLGLEGGPAADPFASLGAPSQAGAPDPGASWSEPGPPQSLPSLDGASSPGMLGLSGSEEGGPPPPPAAGVGRALTAPGAGRAIPTAAGRVQTDLAAAASPPRSGFGLLLFSVLLIFDLFCVFVLWRNDWRADLRQTVAMVRFAVGEAAEPVAVATELAERPRVELIGIRAKIYPNDQGSRLLVLDGRAKNVGSASVRDVQVEGRLIDLDKGSTAAKAEAPVVGPIDQKQLRGVRGSADLQRAYRKLGEDAKPLADGEERGFTLVFLSLPKDLPERQGRFKYEAKVKSVELAVEAAP